jgi:hypothetical protein
MPTTSKGDKGGEGDEGIGVYGEQERGTISPFLGIS